MLLTGLLLFCIVAIALTIFFSKKASNNDHQEGQAVYYVGIIAIPILAATMYYGIGDPNTASLLEGTSQQKEHFDPQSHLEQINKLLSQRPNDPSLLAQVSRIYMMVGKFELAVESARRLVSLEPADPAALVQLADALAMVSGGKITEEIFDILGVVLSIEKTNPIAMTLLGIGYEQRGQNEEALQHWRSAESILPAESPLKSRLTEMIGQVVRKPVVDSKTTQAISVEVHLSEELKNSIRGGSTLFVMLKNEDLKPPISVIKTNVLNFPAKIELSDDNSMLQGVSIENFNSVYAMARISLRGSPLPSRGDLEGRSQNFDPKKTEKISILIEQLVE